MARSSSRLQEKRQANSHTEMKCLAVPDASTQVASGSKRAHDEAFCDGTEDSEEEKRTNATYGARKRTTGKRKKAPEMRQDGDWVESSRSTRKVPADKKFKKIRGKLGLLEKIVTDVPMEVIFEIFSNLRPLDILRLARTSKALRDILMSKSSESIWRAARANVEDLPPLPLDLNEPQYARLMFEPHCHNCTSKARCEIVSWQYRMRCCTKCQSDIFEDATLIEDINGRYGFSRRLLMQIRAVIPLHRIHSTKLRGDIDLCIPSIVKQYASEYKAIAYDDEKRDQWKAQRKREYKSLREHAWLCEQWHKTQLQRRADELNAARARRRGDILARLHEIGWADEARKMMDDPGQDTFSAHKFVNQTTKLTTRGWEQIKEPLIVLLGQHKAERLVRERYMALEARYNLLRTMYTTFCEQGDRLHTPLPSLGDIFASELFDRVIWCTPFDKEIEEEDFSGIFEESLPAFVDEWREARDKELLDLLRQDLPTATPSDLRLATCIFVCTDTSYYCSEELWYPRMFYHRRQHSEPAALAQYRPKHNYIDKAVFDPFQRHYAYPWTPQNIKYSGKDSQTIKTVLERCGLDPATATIDDLCKANPFIECKSESCKHPVIPGRYFCLWMNVFRHADHELSVNSFGEHKEAILADCRRELKTIYQTESVRCRLCNCFQKSAIELGGHLSSVHDISTDCLKDYYYYDPGTRVRDMAFNCTFRFDSKSRRWPWLENSGSALTLL